MSYKVIFFDLDGTLSDPEDGIVNSIQYAADYYGVATRREDLKKYIGPPLYDTFCELLGREKASEAIIKYRERFDAGGGLFENVMYPGVPETLRYLKDRGYALCTASSKPQVFVRRILEYFGIDGYFDFIGGASLDESMSSKEAVMEYVIKKTGANPGDILMVGDRKYDLEAARSFGVDAVGALYGFGSREELSACKYTALIDDIRQLKDIL